MIVQQIDRLKMQRQQANEQGRFEDSNALSAAILVESEAPVFYGFSGYHEGDVDFPVER
jgi:hypothetical protein